MPQATSAFLDLVKQSGLMEAEEFDVYTKTIADKTDEPSQKLADRLIADGKLTKFQVSLLLQGKHKGFILKEKYKILDLIGVGGMGRVFLCEHLLLRRRVAVKTMSATHLKDPSAVDRFMREARAVAALEDPNIVRVHDVEREGPSPLMVMEYVDGQSLQQLVEKEGPLSVKAASDYVVQAARGLRRAAEAGIVHRDIKPSNLLLDKQGVVKILDMGLARFLQPEPKDDLTKKFDSNSVLGTADYLSPEQAVDSTKVDARADIYSLGATFFFLLTGKPLYDMPTVAEKLLAHQMKPMPPLTDYRTDVPDELETVMLKMLAKKPADRYQTATDVVDALKPWVNEKTPEPMLDVEEKESTTPTMRGSDRTTKAKPRRDRSEPFAIPKPERKQRKQTATPDRTKYYLIGGGALFALIVGIIIAMLSSKKPDAAVALKKDEDPPARKEEPAAVKEEPVIKKDPPVVKKVPPVVKKPEEKKVEEKKVEEKKIEVAMVEDKKPEDKKPEEKKPDDPIVKKPDPPKIDPKMAKIAPEEASKHIGETVTIEFTVQATGSTPTKTMLFLNSIKNFTDATCFTVVLPKKVGEQMYPETDFNKLDARFLNKKVSVQGKIADYKGRAQIQISEAGQLKMVE